jgi:hypothetical protein
VRGSDKVKYLTKKANDRVEYRAHSDIQRRQVVESCVTNTIKSV